MAAPQRYLRAPHVRAWGELQPCDLRACNGPELRIGLRCGTGLVWSVPGETVDHLGLLAITMGRDGQPLTVHIPQEVPVRALLERQDDEEDGA